jgi:hypothetical protein
MDAHKVPPTIVQDLHNASSSQPASHGTNLGADRSQSSNNQVRVPHSATSVDLHLYWPPTVLILFLIVAWIALVICVKRFRGWFEDNVVSKPILERLQALQLYTVPLLTALIAVAQGGLPDTIKFELDKPLKPANLYFIALVVVFVLAQWSVLLLTQWRRDLEVRRSKNDLAVAKQASIAERETMVSGLKQVDEIVRPQIAILPDLLIEYDEQLLLTTVFPGLLQAACKITELALRQNTDISSDIVSSVKLNACLWVAEDNNRTVSQLGESREFVGAKKVQRQQFQSQYPNPA